MLRCCGKLHIVQLGLFFFLAQAVSAQETTDPSVTRVTLGSAYGVLGASVVVPVYFTPAEGLEIGRLKLEVRFVSSTLKFLKIDRGIAAEMADVDLSAQVRTERDDEGVEVTTVNISASFLSQVPPKRGVPAGVLAYLAMRVEERGRPGITTLRTTAEAAELTTNKPVRSVQAFQSAVKIVAPESEPMINCFFFSH